MNSIDEQLPRWIGPDETLEVGSVGFLIGRCRTMNGGATSYHLSDTPAHTNQSHEPRLAGWCGTTNDIATYAVGLAKVTKLARNGRAFVVPVEGEALTAALEELGYPELR
jgi:hypothetical protein